MTDETKLLPCPFCFGEKCVSTEIAYGDDCRCRWLFACCNSCEARGPAAKTEEEAIAAWNRRASGWINCKEKLPEDGQTVLGCLKDGKSIHVFDFFNSAKGSTGAWNLGDYDWGTDEMLAWQPLPPAPKGRSNE